MKISYLKSITLLLILILIASCEKDDSQIIENEDQQESKYNSSITTLKELEGNEKLSNALDKILSNDSYQARGTEIHGITVDSSMVKVIEMEDFKTYTMLMLSSEVSRSNFSNLVIKTFNSSETVEAYVFEYPQEQSMEYYEPGQSFTFTGGANLYTLDTGFPNQTFSQTCITTSVTICWQAPGGGTGPIHIAGPICRNNKYKKTIWSENCFGVPDFYPGSEGSAEPYNLCLKEDCSGVGGSYTGGPDEETDLPTETVLVLAGVYFENPSQELINWWTFYTPEQEYERERLKNEIKTFLNENKESGESYASEEAQKIAKEVIEISREIPSVKLKRYTELLDIIESDPMSLIEDCAQQNGMDTQDYVELYNHEIPQECKDRLFNLGTGYTLQDFDDGNVALANIDYYGVEITTNPDFNGDNQPDTATEMYQEFRGEFTELASGEQQNFEFSCNVPGNSTNTGYISWEFEPFSNNDANKFVSNDPINSILLIEADASGLFPWIANDDGAIMVSGYTSSHWTISTIRQQNNGTQPFSGNRRWGLETNQNGNLEFFTKAVDVANISKILNILSLGNANTECQQDTYYNIAEATWQNLQTEIIDWINNNGGQAQISNTYSARVKKEKIIDLLTQNESITDLNCN